MKKFNETLETFFMATVLAEMGEFDMIRGIIEGRRSHQDREI
jgi:hypothetical protein